MTRKEAIEIINRENDPNDKKVWEVFPEYREALDMAISALEQQPCDTDNCKIVKAFIGDPCKVKEPCDDAISREAAISAIVNADNAQDEIDSIRALPSVTQKSKTGHWIYTEYHTWCCSECGGNPHKGTGFVPNKDGMKMRWKYCNLCGAEMKGEKNETDN